MWYCGVCKADEQNARTNTLLKCKHLNIQIISYGTPSRYMCDVCFDVVGQDRILFSQKNY